MLDALGISHRATDAYVVLIDDPEICPQALAARTGATLVETCGDLAELASAGLIAAADASPCGYRPLPPDIAIAMLARQHRRAEATDEADPGYPDGTLDVLPPGATAAAGYAEMLHALGGHAVAIWQPEDPADPGFLTVDDLAAAARCHVTVQVIYPESVGTPPDQPDGVEVRVCPGPALPMTIVDRRIAVLAPTGPDDSGLVVRGEHLVGTLRHAFDAAWRDQPPELPAALDAMGRRLASGVKDDTIARHLEVNPRTVRRQAAALLDHLGSATRFQAGYALGRRDAATPSPGHRATTTE